MSSIYRDNLRNGWRAQVFVRGHRRKLWLGPISRTAALKIAGHLEQLKLAAETATAIPADTDRWARAVNQRIRENLARWGLIDLGARSAEIPRTLGGYSQFWIDGRQDNKRTTRARWRNCRNKLLAQWPESTAMRSITPGDCDRFAAALRKSHAPSHAGKLIADARQLFAGAVRDRVLTANPLDGINASAPHDRRREAYITAESARLLIEAASPQLACLIALARFGGLRVPSEPLALRLLDVDLPAGRLTIPGVKTATRSVPITPELRPHLETLYEIAPPGSEWLIASGRSSAATLWRKQLISAITRAGLEPWPKLWQNLRASARTDFEERFPSHVINAWLGHSSRVGQQHYTRLHDGHFAAAIAGCGALGGAPGPTSADTPRCAADNPAQ